MAILGKKRLLLVLASIALSITGCMLAGRSPKRFAFSHAEHVIEQGLDCVGCHAEAGRAESPGMPDPDACSVCHDEIDAAKSPGARVAALFDGSMFRASHSIALDDELKFSHAKHVDVVGDCAACHADVVSSDASSPDIFTMDRCTTCHAGRKVDPACSTCHTQVDASIAPHSHRVDWKRGHGRCARSGSDATADRCSLCHQESSCIQCHREEAPLNHNAYWMQRGHGLTARLDRENCAACHREDSCASCHAEQMPQNHTASFGSPRNTHCVSCHSPLQNAGCSACHRDTRSHSLAAPKPSDPVHSSGQNCRQCHGLSAPLPHVDNGDDCNACHH